MCPAARATQSSTLACSSASLANRRPRFASDRSTRWRSSLCGSSSALIVLRFISAHSEPSQARTSGWASNSVFNSSPLASSTKSSRSR